MDNDIVVGYKVLNLDWTSFNGFRYELNKWYTHSGEIKLHNSGFHFCRQTPLCYEFTSSRIPTPLYTRVECKGKIIDSGDGVSVCSEIRIVQVIDKEKWYQMCQGKFTTPDGMVRHYRGTYFHCEYEPALQWSDGKREWFFNGFRHRKDGPAVEWPNGSKEWYNHIGQLRREDGPAIEYASGTKEWWRDGNLYRDGNGPAIEHFNGVKEWFQDRVCHREGKPAIEWPDGSEAWLIKGKYHRKDGPAIQIYNLPTIYLYGRDFKKGGIKIWLLNNKIHNEGGHAIEWPDGSREWYKHGKLDREDGPAIIYSNGVEEWYKDGILERKTGSQSENTTWSSNGESCYIEFLHCCPSIPLVE